MDGKYIFIVFVLIFGLFLFFRGISLFRFNRIVKNTPTSMIRSIAMGQVEIYGQVVPLKEILNVDDTTLLKSPFSDKNCIYYEYIVEEYQSDGKHHSWRNISSGVQSTYFKVKDDTGEVLVDLKGAKIEIPSDNRFEYTGNNLSESALSFLSSRHVAVKSLFNFNRKLRFTEFVIEPGDNLYILGIAGKNPFVQTNIAESDDNIMIQKGKSRIFGGDLYYVSDFSEKDVLKKIKWKIVGYLFGGAAMILFDVLVSFR
ncbi:MAG: GIDE domain-containing protein [Candidatus Woesearchaeota archaeon]